MSTSADTTRGEVSRQDEEGEIEVKVDQAMLQSLEKGKIQLGKEPMLLSSYLELNDTITDELVAAFDEKAGELSTKSHKTKYESRWLIDFIKSSPALRRICVLQIKSESDDFATIHDGVDHRTERRRAPSLTPQERVTSPQPHIYDSPREQQFITDQPTTTINLKNLVLTPETFDGFKPPARKWVDDYERAAKANGWSEQSTVRYFETFLSKGAHDWFLTMGQRKFSKDPFWKDLRAAFIRHYLGDCDKSSLRRQIERTYQKEREPATIFIPRLLRLYQLADPTKQESDLVEAVKDRLRPDYQEKLAMHVIYTLEQLNDLCIRIEAGKVAARSVANAIAREHQDDKTKKNKKDDKDDDKDDSKEEGKAGETSKRTNKDELKCYRCDRYGHISRNCEHKERADGGPVREKKSPLLALPTAEQGKEELTSDESAKVKQEPQVWTIATGSRLAGKTHFC